MKLAIILCAITTLIVASEFAFDSKKPTVIARFSTSLDGRIPSQQKNAVLALKKIDGVRIAPNEIFSFNRTVGTWTRDQGYTKAPVSYNGMLIRSWGGGVCQTSTTLYNAALLAGLEIVERHPHLFAPKYVPPGRDAAVAYEEVDLQFRNVYETPIQIHAWSDGRSAKVELLSSSEPVPSRVYHEILSQSLPETYQIRTQKNAFRVRNSGINGWQVAVWRVSRGKRELISTDSYPAMNRIIETR